jgi:hypothetical protein
VERREAVPIDERTRHALYLRLEAVLGPAQAETLMEHLPPVGWADVATTRDVDSLRAATGRDVEILRAEMEHGFSQLRGEMRHELGLVRGEMQHEFGLVRGEMATQKAEILGLVSDRLRTQTWVMFSALVAGIGAAAATARL